MPWGDFRVQCFYRAYSAHILEYLEVEYWGLVPSLFFKVSPDVTVGRLIAAPVFGVLDFGEKRGAAIGVSTLYPHIVFDKYPELMFVPRLFRIFDRRYFSLEQLGWCILR